MRGQTDNLNINNQGGPNNAGGGGGGGGGESGNCSQSEVATGSHQLWGLLWLNPRAQGEYLTNQLSWAAA